MSHLFAFFFFASLALGFLWVLWRLWTLPDYLARKDMERLKKAMVEAGVDEDTIFIHEQTLFTVNKK